MKQLLIVMLIIIVVEGVLVNTVINAGDLPNYPDPKTSSKHFSDVWQRIYAYGGNSSVTGVLLVAVLSIVEPSFFLVLSSIVLLFFVGSGSGVISLVFYVLSILNKNLKLLFLVWALIIWYFFVPDIDALYKISPKYFEVLLALKQEQMLKVIDNMDGWQIFFGTASVSNMGGDFLWKSFFHTHGIAGVMLMLFFMLTHINRSNVFGVFIIFLMTSHYFVLFSLPGQLIAGYLLAIKPGHCVEVK